MRRCGTLPVRRRLLRRGVPGAGPRGRHRGDQPQPARGRHARRPAYHPATPAAGRRRGARAGRPGLLGGTGRAVDRPGRARSPPGTVLCGRRAARGPGRGRRRARRRPRRGATRPAHDRPAPGVAGGVDAAGRRASGRARRHRRDQRRRPGSGTQAAGQGGRRRAVRHRAAAARRGAARRGMGGGQRPGQAGAGGGAAVGRRHACHPPVRRADGRGNLGDAGAPFDYARQAILYVAAHLPRPTTSGLSEAAANELLELVRALGGRTLGLFSSRRAAERAAEVLRAKTDLVVLLQGEEALPLLVRRFREERNSCLLGVMSLWQGVDVPGEACQLVVIDRLPFPRPDEPLAAARAAAVDAAGGSGFAAVSVPIAAVRLAQGVGRLIRSAADRGVVAVLDSRLETARGYGAYLRRSLPPFWYTTKPEVVRSALARLAQS